MKERLLISFSGGKSSAYMTQRLLKEYNNDYEFLIVFANTGQEREETLLFVKQCSESFGVEVVWLEAVVNHGKRLGSSHKIVSFETCSRNGEPFEEMIVKYGIPNKAYPHCTRELKLNPIHSYMKSIGWEKCLTAVGIRADEPRRIRNDPSLIYPMVNLFPSTKTDVNEYWEDQTFTLNLKEHEGNCSWCWKKSLKKHVRLYNENPSIFEFPLRMEKQYGLNGHNIDGTERKFFRSNTSTIRLIEIAKEYGQNNTEEPERPDEDSGCSESCEAFTAEAA